MFIIRSLHLISVHFWRYLWTIGEMASKARHKKFGSPSILSSLLFSLTTTNKNRDLSLQRLNTLYHRVTDKIVVRAAAGTVIEFRPQLCVLQQ